eukprot:COSAG02_NODE_1259_length_13568_cov_747.342267_5_plen_185_part_00
MALSPVLLILVILAAEAGWSSVPPPPILEPYYTVEVDRAGKGGFNVLFDGHNRPDTTDFAINNGPSFVRLLDGTDALVIRSCVNRTGCSTPGNPDVITLVKRRKEPVDLSDLQSQFERNTMDKIILRPRGPDEQCGVQDPRITVDPRTRTYIMAYTACKCNTSVFVWWTCATGEVHVYRSYGRC